MLVLLVEEVNGQRTIRLDLVDHPVDPEGFEAIIRRSAQAFQEEKPDPARLERINEEIHRHIRERYGDRWWVLRLRLARTTDGDLVFSLRDTAGAERLHLRLSGETLSGYVVTPEGEKVPLRWREKP